MPKPPSHPYTTLPDRAFWRRGVVDDGGAGLSEIYQPRAPITPETAVATAGSCFAQHIGGWLRKSGIKVLDAEPAPALMSDEAAHAFGYRLFSGRYGNIYTARQLRQLLDDVATGSVSSRFVWETDRGRYVDAFRPTVEPDGLATAAEVLLHRDYHLEKTAQMLRQTDLFVFTLGLAETWVDRSTDRAFPVCPGIAGGAFDPEAHALAEFRPNDVYADLVAIRTALQRFNPGMRLLLTVSPVPLTATATGAHVLAATTAAKACLRSAAESAYKDFADIDYFPSYELVTSPATGGPWFASNLRSVRPEGVRMVMTNFLASHGLSEAQAAPRTDTEDDTKGDTKGDIEDDLICDELLYQAAAQ